jgi:hypothetical protein
MKEENLKENFKAHLCSLESKEKLKLIREECLKLAELINEIVPEGKEKEISLMKTEEVMFWANAGIARKDD